MYQLAGCLAVFLPVAGLLIALVGRLYGFPASVILYAEVAALTASSALTTLVLQPSIRAGLLEPALKRIAIFVALGFAFLIPVWIFLFWNIGDL